MYLTPRKIDAEKDGDVTKFYYVNVIEHNLPVLSDEPGNQVCCHQVKVRAEEFETMNPQQRIAWAIEQVTLKINREKEAEYALEQSNG